MYVALLLMSILLLATFSQWLAWVLRLPAILFLLAAGILIGPISAMLIGVKGGLLDPSILFGDRLLYPVVSLSVAIILFEGCMTLKFREIKGIGGVVRNLITLGLLLTAIITTVLAHYILKFPWSISALLGAIASVSGPTVVVPILRSVRPSAKLANIIRWEGMLVDPIGALLAAIVYSAITSLTQFQALTHVLLHIFGVAFIGLAVGLVMGYFLGLVLRRHWVPDYLSNLFALSSVVAAFVLADYLIEGGGLLAVTVMGVLLGNMRNTHIDEVIDFKEHLSMLLISVLFIILAANVTFDNLEQIIGPAIILILCLQFIVRPVVTAICTLKSDLNWRERLLLAWIAPRGIVAAAVAALFSIKVIKEMGHGNPDMIYYGNMLALMTFLIIIGTVAIPSVTAPFLAKILKVSAPDPRGFLIVGANCFARKVATALQEQGFSVILTDLSWRKVQAAKLAGLNAYYGNPVSEHADWHLDLVGIGRMLGMSKHYHINTLAAIKYRREFGRHAIFIMPSANFKASDKLSPLNRKYSKRLFTRDYDSEQLEELVEQGAVVKTTNITSVYTWEDYIQANGSNAIPLFAINAKGVLHVISPDSVINIHPGWKVISLVKAV